MPEGYSVFDPAGGHKIIETQHGTNDNYQKEKWFFTNGIFIAILALIFLVNTIVYQGISTDTIFYLSFWAIVLVVALYFVIKSKREINQIRK